MNLPSNISADHTRRAFLSRSLGGLGSVALASLMNDKLLAEHQNLSRFHHAPKAKRVIFLFMAGGPSHIDLFDPKPKLKELDGKPIPQELLFVSTENPEL
jgi:hypothetical protein